MSRLAIYRFPLLFPPVKMFSFGWNSWRKAKKAKMLLWNGVKTVRKVFAFMFLPFQFPSKSTKSDGLSVSKWIDVFFFFGEQQTKKVFLLRIWLDIWIYWSLLWQNFTPLYISVQFGIFLLYIWQKINFIVSKSCRGNAKLMSQWNLPKNVENRIAFNELVSIINLIQLNLLCLPAVFWMWLNHSIIIHGLCI